MKQAIQDLLIEEIKFLSPAHFLLTLRSPLPLPEMLPGQFAQVLVKNSPATFLRRPLSIHDMDKDRECFTLLIRIAGPGTHALSLLKKGETINVIYPLGKGFSIPEKGKLLLAGGGCGVAPLLFLARSLKEQGLEQTILLGGRTDNDILESDTFRKLGEVLVSTEDGSSGESGLLTQHSIWKEIHRFSQIYCCGPEAMMKAVAGMAVAAGVECEVSLENLMACGFGACLCCVTPTVRGNECVCTSGPVFNVKDLTWQI